MKLSEMQRKLNMDVEAQFETVNINMISNIVFEPYFQPFISDIFVESGMSVNVTYLNTQEYQSAENVDKMRNADLLIVALNFEYLYPNSINDICSGMKSIDDYIDISVYNCSQVYQYIKSKTHAHILWLGFEDYCYQYNFANNIIDQINNYITAMIEGTDIYVDVKRIIANVGIKAAYDSKGKYRWNIPYSKQLISELCNEIHKQYLVLKGISKKCIVLDCDNVLWGGILSEDGIENIHLGTSGLGRSFQDFQRYLLNLYFHGVILSVCSKNDLSDVIKMFRGHSEMILKEEHIACFQVNWDNKAVNINKIAEALNIGLDSMVFIDDSEFEIGSVKSILPEVTTILYNRDTVKEQLSCFNLKPKVDMDIIEQRNRTYRTNKQREFLKSEYQNFNDYLQALEMKIDIHQALPIEYSRIAELTQRTNKCTNGKRYTVAELKEKVLSDIYKLYSVSVSDKFSDLGLVGVIGINDKILDLFSLSCRALGRNVEDKIFKVIARESVNDFIFISTGKNDNIKEVLEKIKHN